MADSEDEVCTEDIYTWIDRQDFKTTAEIPVPERLVDQVIGQDQAVRVIRKAAEQRRHLMLIGEPGTGKSMLANSMVEFLPSDDLEDILAYPNPDDPNEPRIRKVPAGKGKQIVNAQKAEALQRKEQKSAFMSMFIFFIIIGAFILYITSPTRDPSILLIGIIGAAFLFLILRSSGQRSETNNIPKLLVSHTPGELPPFVDATGAHAGALLGDVRHDPFQSGGLETPAHERVEAGAIHRAHKGVLFIDEINTLRMESQQSLLTALQERKFSIVGQSERSAGAMVKTEPVPTDFVMVAAGNLDAINGMHPALRSRIRGYGYEIYMNTTMLDTESNRKKLIRFVAQEVVKDGKIPHFTKNAVAEILHEAQRRSGRMGRLTLRLRELGGLIRVAGDMARENNSILVDVQHVRDAKLIARSLEQQVADRFVSARKEYKTFVTEGTAVGMVNGLAALNAESNMNEYSGIVLPIVAEVTPAQTKSAGRIIATGKLGEIAKEAVLNVSALVKKYTGEDISNHDVHVQFIGTYEGVEGDSASISVATAVISALENVPVDQSVAMTGSLSVRGQVLPVGGVTAKLEAAAEMGIRKALIPLANMRDVLIEDRYRKKLEIIPVGNLRDVLEHALVESPMKEKLLKKLSDMVEAVVVAPKEKKAGIPVPSPSPSPN